jgi:chromosome segregation ATPase
VFVEQIMIFALGFLCAGLLTLLFLPAFWRRAMTLSRRQIEMQIPLSMAEVVAERDQLRAEFAAEQRKLEQRLDALNETRARERVELGERGIRAAKLTEELKSLRNEFETTATQLAAARLESAQTQAESSAGMKQLFDAEGLLAQRETALQSTRTELAALQMLADSQRTSIAGLETRLSSREADLEALDREFAEMRIELEQAQADIELLARERGQYRADAQAARTRRDALQQDLEAQARKLGELENAMRLAEREKVRMTSDLNEAGRLLEDERRRVKDLSVRIADHNEAVRKVERKAAADAELARAGNAALEGALAAQRRENETARAEIARLREALRAAGNGGADSRPAVFADTPSVAANDPGTAPTDLPTLRKAIVNLGQEIARVAVELDKARAESARAPGNAAHPDAAE